MAFLYKNLSGIRPLPTPSHLEVIADVPPFRLVDESGAEVTQDDLKGRITVANFIFTRCKGPCPVMTSRMAELSRKLGKASRDVQLVSFTVDPEHDTPPVLATYASQVGAKAPQWRFFTGPPDDVLALVVKGLLQPVAKEPTGDVAHSTRFVLIDRAGRLRGFQDGNDPEVVQKLLMDLGDLLREPSTAPTPGAE